MAAEVRYALIILDGLGDRIAAGNEAPTPLELARTPNLDRLASEGSFGRASILGPGIAPESDAGVLALLGYDPVRDSPGRGVLEAIGSEIPLEPGDVALRLNFATADGDGNVVDSRVGRNLTTGESAALAEAVTQADLLAPEQVRAVVRATVGHRGVLWLHPTAGGELSGNVSNSDPFYDKVGGMGQARKPSDAKIRPVQPLDATPEAARTARAINLLVDRVPAVLSAQTVNARRALAGKKVANVLLLRNAGGLPRPGPTPFAERHARAGSAVTEMPVERGIARLFHLADHFVGPMGADRDAALRERAQLTRRVLAESPFVYVHLKGPDEPAHDGLAEVKREVIEALDRSFFGPFLEGLDPSGVRMVVTADHATPATMKSHSDDPVPLLFWGSGVSASGKRGKFSERFCAEFGTLGVRPGREVLPLLFGPSVPPGAP